MILHRYIARRFLMSLATVFFVFMVFTAFLDLIEQLRIFRNSDATFGQLVTLMMLDLPQGLYQILPLIVILATISLFLGLARSSEMVVVRAAGRSALRTLISPIIVALALGVVAVGVFNPIVAATSKEYEARAAALRSGVSNVSALSDGGLWLRQGSELSQTVIRAEGANLDGTQLRGVTFIRFTSEGGPQRRIEAKSATLSEGAWVLNDAKIWTLTGTQNAEASARSVPTLSVPSSLTVEQIRDSFGTPSSIPVWELPRFINGLKTAGLSARRHQVWLHVELSQPIFFMAMLLISSAFTMRHQRSGRTGLMVLYTILLGFSLFFIRNFAVVLGENGQIPVALAAWAPPLAAIGLSLGLLLHLEDG